MKLDKFQSATLFVPAVIAVLTVFTVLPGFALAQDESGEGDEAALSYEEYLQEYYGDVEEVDELIADLDTPEEEQAPAPTAASTQPDSSLPPHPATPERLEEGTPTAETLASTIYVWIRGNWIWTGEAFEWVDGVWAYPLEGYHYVESEWVYQTDTWVFTAAGWAPAGSVLVQYGVVPVPEEGEQPVTEYQVEPATTTVYVYSGVYVAPLIVYPVWHVHYHSYWYVHYRPVHRYHHPYRRTAVRRSARRHHHYRHHRSTSSRHHSSRGRNTRPSTSPSRSNRGSSGGRASQPRSSQQRSSRQQTSRQRSSGSRSQSRGGSVSRGRGGGGRGGGGRR